MEPLQQQQQQPSAKLSSDAAAAVGVGVVVSEAEMVSSAEDYPELHIVFDFFADNPQKVMPNDATGPQRDNPFFDPYWESIRLMQSNELFLEGTLLKSVDCKPHFPYLHYIIYKSALPVGGNGGVSGDKSRPGIVTPDPLTNGRVSNPELNKQFVDILRSQGGYCEMSTFISRGTSLLPKRPSNPNTAYIVSAFKTAGNLDSLDRTWTYWSGADYIVENIPPSLKLERVTFHKLKYGLEKENFSYVLLCEIGEAMADLNRSREFIDTLKYRQCGVTSMYVIDHFF